MNFIDHKITKEYKYLIGLLESKTQTRLEQAAKRRKKIKSQLTLKKDKYYPGYTDTKFRDVLEEKQNMDRIKRRLSYLKKVN